MPRFVEPLEPRRLLSVSPTIQADLNLVQGTSPASWRTRNMRKGSASPTCTGFASTSGTPNPSEKHLFNVFNGKPGPGSW